jgi:hypothetical protein
MWVKRVGVIVLICFMLGTAYAYADNQGLFKGFQKVKVMVNSKELSNLSVPGFVIDGKTVLPLRDLADAVNAVVLWDANTQTVNLIRPNAHLLIADSVGKDTVKKVFGKVAKGKKEVDFSVFVQVDGLSEPVSKLKLTVEDPSGTVIDSYEQKLVGVDGDFWLVRPFEVRFTQSGKYTVNLFVQMEKSEEFAKISSKSIVSE